MLNLGAMVHLGGKNARFQRVHGDIVASYQYVNKERAMALWPRYPKSAAGAFIVCDSSAWRYNPDLPRSEWHNPETGELWAGPHYLMMQAITAAQVMGMDTTKPTVVRIASIIAEGLEDLIRLKPWRPEYENGGEKKKPVGEAALIVNGKTLAEKEV